MPPETIRTYGAVSEETARAMASAACAAYGADCGIAVTGVAGPDDVDGVKAGTVYIAVAHPGGVDAQLHQFPSRRPLVRARAVTAALLQLLRALREG